MENCWNDIDGGKRDVIGEKPVQMPLFFFPHPTWTGLGLDLSQHGESLSADHVSHGVATCMLHNIVIVLNLV
jgi:hypothetical protein